MPVYVVKRCDGEGHERTLHRNMLFPLALPRADDNAGGIGVLPETDTESSGSDSRALTRSRQAPVEEQSSSCCEDEEIQVITDESGNDIQARNLLSSHSTHVSHLLRNPVPMMTPLKRRMKMHHKFARVPVSNAAHNGLGMTHMLCTHRQFPHHSGRTRLMFYGVIFPSNARRSMTVCYKMLISCSHG